MTKDKLDEKENMDIFIAKYELAIEENKEEFIFFGSDVLVSYAKYVIENYNNNLDKGKLK